MLRNFVFLFFCTPILLHAQSAFIAGNDTICDNTQDAAEIIVSFNGVSPFTFVYSINGDAQPSITTTINPYVINTKEAGGYSLVGFSDINGPGTVSGQGKVTVLEHPTSIIHLSSDTVSMLVTNIKFIDQSIGNITTWQWDFGDNTNNDFAQNPYHTYDSLGIYQISLIVIDNMGCRDTTTTVMFVRDLCWMYFPNTFTPDNDLLNDKFCIEFNGIREETFLFKVFNPIGDIVFESNNPNALRCSINGGWDGSHYLTGKSLPMTDPVANNVYVFTLYYQDFEGWKHYENGEIMLVR